MRDFFPGTSAALIFAAIMAFPMAAWADAPDALAKTALTDPMSNSKSGTVQTRITATIRQSIQVDYAIPATAGADGGNSPGPALQRVSADIPAASRGKASRLAMTAFVEVQGIPNQTFGISIQDADGTGRGLKSAIFSHNGGVTPHLDPGGDGGFSIDARLDLAHMSAGYGQGGALDVIVSHN